MIAACGSVLPISVSSGPGPSLPFSPILWQARQPDCAATSLPGSYSGLSPQKKEDLVAFLSQLKGEHEGEDGRGRDEGGNPEGGVP